MRALLCSLVMISSSALAEGDELEAVRTVLGAMTGQEPVQASAAVSRWERVTGEKPPQEASAGAVFFLSATKTSVNVSCNQSQLTPKPAKKNDGPPDVLGNIVASVDLPQTSRWLNHAAPLLHQLENAEVLENKQTTLDKRPARRLTLKLKTEKQSESGAEATIERTLTLWVDAEHVPLASQSEANTSGGFLVVRFENHQKAERKFVKAGDRLMTIEETQSDSTSSMGHVFQNKQTVKLTVK